MFPPFGWLLDMKGTKGIKRLHSWKIYIIGIIMDYDGILMKNTLTALSSLTLFP